MKEKIRRKTIGRICALVLVGMFVAMTSMSISANDPDDWTIGGDSFGGSTTQSLGTTTNDNLQVITNNQARIFVGASGNVGIGTTSPGDTLDVNGDIRVRGADIKDAGGTARITLTDNGGLDLKEDGGSTSLSIATDGKVGIGTTSPGGNLDVREDTQDTEAKLRVYGGNVIVTPRVVSGVYLGGIDYGRKEAAAIKMIAEPYWVMGDTPSALAFYTTPNGSSTAQERMRIDSSGNVLIGYSSPFFNAKLSVNGGAALIGDIYTAGYAVVQESAGIGTTSIRNRLDVEGNVAIGSSYSGTYTAPSNGLIVEGDVGIGTTGPTVKLEVAGDTKISGSLYVALGDAYLVGIGTTSPTGKLDINGNDIRIRSPQTPASASASGNTGEICWDQEYIYVCVGTNTWKKAAISTW